MTTLLFIMAPYYKVLPYKYIYVYIYICICVKTPLGVSGGRGWGLVRAGGQAGCRWGRRRLKHQLTERTEGTCWLIRLLSHPWSDRGGSFVLEPAA